MSVRQKNVSIGIEKVLLRMLDEITSLLAAKKTAKANMQKQWSHP